MYFIKLGKRYVNLDNVAAILPKQEGLGYTINFIGYHATMDICEADMVDIIKEIKFIKKLCAINHVEIIGEPYDKDSDVSA